MKAISYAFLALSAATLVGCATAKVSEEYGANMGATMFACPGKTWHSKVTNESYCVSQSVKNPYDYMISEDTAEEWGDAFVYGVTLGLAGLFESDIQEKWLKAARELAVEKYGPGSRVDNFRPNNGQWKAMAFEIVPASPPSTNSAVAAASSSSMGTKVLQDAAAGTALLAGVTVESMCDQPSKVDQAECRGLIKMGMTRNEALRVLGAPNGKSADEKTLRYGDRYLAFDGADRLIGIRESKVD